MVSKTDDIPASVPNCNPVDLADEAGDGAQDGKETSKTHLKDSCGCGEALSAVNRVNIHHKYNHNIFHKYRHDQHLCAWTGLFPVTVCVSLAVSLHSICYIIFSMLV